MDESDFQRVRARFDRYKDIIPEHMRIPMEGYIFNKVPPGSFLYAVLSNDLKGAVAKADHINIQYLDAYVRFMFYVLPSQAWGSEENVKAWLYGGES